MSGGVKSLKELAAQVIVKEELVDDLEDLGEGLNDLIRKAAAKEALKDADVARCVKLYKQSLALIKKRIKSWEQRHDAQIELGKGAKSDKAQLAEWNKLIDRADKSYEKYDNLYKEFADYSKKLKGIEQLDKGVNTTILLSNINILRSNIKDVANAKIPK
jgi:hypothetical protein